MNPFAKIKPAPAANRGKSPAGTKVFSRWRKSPEEKYKCLSQTQRGESPQADLAALYGFSFLNSKPCFKSLDNKKIFVYTTPSKIQEIKP